MFAKGRIGRCVGAIRVQKGAKKGRQTRLFAILEFISDGALQQTVMNYLGLWDGSEKVGVGVQRTELESIWR